jgi:hypothetical protein
MPWTRIPAILTGRGLAANRRRKNAIRVLRMAAADPRAETLLKRKK